MKTLSIIIVSYNTKEMLRDLLQSLRQYLPADYSHEVIVVDNASEDGSAAMVAEDFPETVVIANKDNLGFSKANNIGIALAQGEIINLLNPDTLLLPDNEVRNILQKFADNPRIGVLGGRIFDGHGRQGSSFGHFPTASTLWLHYSLPGRLMARAVPALRKRRLLNYDRRALEREAEVDHVHGSCFFVRKQVFDELGMLDERFFMYLEETDLCMRAHEAQWKVVYYPATTVIHFGQGSSRPIRELVSRQFLKSLRLYFEKYYQSDIYKLELLIKLNIIKLRM